MKKNITTAVILLSFAMMLIGCMTEKKAVQQIAKISHKQPEVLANECGKRYPPIDSIWEKETFIEGETMVVVDTVLVDCDSVSKIPVLTKIVKVPVASKLRVDTFYKTKFQQVENTAMIEANRLQINKLENEAIEQAHGKKVWRLIALVLALFFVIGFVWKWLKKKFTFNIF